MTSPHDERPGVPADPTVRNRKRKKYRFAMFARSPLCFEAEEWQQGPVDVVEVGAGTGLFLVELASRAPGERHLALDIKGDRLQKGAYRASDVGLDNVEFLRGRAEELETYVAPSSVRHVWITFPDPHHRAGSASKRLTHPRFLHSYARLLADDGRLVVKHDDADFVAWSLRRLAECGWVVHDTTDDVHAAGWPEPYTVMTTYEQRWLAAGRTTKAIIASPPPSTSP